MAAYRYVVRGRVQGVGYRYYALHAARDLGVRGFARNLPDGTVEVVGEASDEALTRFEEKLRAGPSFSQVDALDRAALEPRGDLDFHIR